MQRNTIQRSLVLDAVRDLQSHATADEVHQHVAQQHPTISKATVYRNLRKLDEEQEIHALDLPGEPERFDHLTYPHYHVKCTVCGRIADIDMEYDEGLSARIKDAGGFDIAGHDIVFWGICPACKEKQADR